MVLIPTTILTGASSGLFATYAMYREQQVSGTDGGTLTSGSWQTRVLNTEVFDPGGIGTLASNQVTLGAGTYYVEAVAPFALNGSISAQTVLRVRNVTDGVTLALGPSSRGGALSAQLDGGGIAYVSGRFTLSGTKAVELQHRTTQTQTTVGLGKAASLDEVEVFAAVTFWREGTSGSSSGSGPTLIQEIIVPSGGSASVDFTSIPSTYRHLEIWYVARSEGTASDINLRFNNDSAANYRLEVIRGSGTSASAATLTAQTQANIASVPATGSGYDSHGKIIFPYYATGAFNRIAVSNYGLYDGTNSQVGSFSAQWSGTAAITQITLLISGLDIKEGSIFSLYGIV